MAVEVRSAEVQTPWGDSFTMDVYAGVQEGQAFDDGEVLFINVTQGSDKCVDFVRTWFGGSVAVRDFRPGKGEGCVVRPTGRR